MHAKQESQQPRAKMEATMKRQAMKLLLLALPLIFLALACEAQAPSTAPAPAPRLALIYRNRFIPLPVKEAVKRDLLRFLGLPPTTVPDTADWTTNAVQFVLEKLNWPYNVPIDGNDTMSNFPAIQDAVLNVMTVMKWFLADYQLNPFKSLTQGMPSFTKLYLYIQSLKEGKAFGGEQNPVYKCLKNFYPKCEKRMPQVLLGALVYRFECDWEFYDKCKLRYWAKDGNWKVPDFNAPLPSPPPARVD